MNTHNRRLIVRLRIPSIDKMVVEVELGREYLGRCWESNGDKISDSDFRS